VAHFVFHSLSRPVGHGQNRFVNLMTSSISSPPLVDPITVTTAALVQEIATTPVDDQALSSEERVQEINMKSRDADGDYRYNLEMKDMANGTVQVPATMIMDTPVSLNQIPLSPENFEWLDKDLDDAQAGNPIDWDQKETRCAGCMTWINSRPKGIRYLGYSAVGTIILMLPGIIDLAFYIESAYPPRS